MNTSPDLAWIVFLPWLRLSEMVEIGEARFMPVGAAHGWSMLPPDSNGLPPC
jgi:hypothetical protein